MADDVNENFNYDNQMNEAESGKSVPSERNKTISPFVTESKSNSPKSYNGSFNVDESIREKNNNKTERERCNTTVRFRFTKRSKYWSEPNEKVDGSSSKSNQAKQSFVVDSKFYIRKSSIDNDYKISSINDTFSIRNGNDSFGSHPNILSSNHHRNQNNKESGSEQQIKSINELMNKFSRFSTIHLSPILCDGHSRSLEEKNEFLHRLNLIPVRDYHKIVATKTSRKRRTTANPQFSSAAIEAKRITKQEIANERKHKKQLALERSNRSNQNDLQNPHKNSNQQQISEQKLVSSKFEYYLSQDVFNSTNEFSPGLYYISNNLISEKNCKICDNSEPKQISSPATTSSQSVRQQQIIDFLICIDCLSIFHSKCLIDRYLNDRFMIKCDFCYCDKFHLENREKRKQLKQKIKNMKRNMHLIMHRNDRLEIYFKEKREENALLVSKLNSLIQQIERIRKIMIAVN
uniref:Uncharacterized protein n=1 Tax=Sarcoptes scabiei TaxID=52283 RepID=A0A834VAB7_SARSC